LNGNGIDEWRVSAVNFPRLVEQVLARNVGLTFFVIFRSGKTLDLRQGGFRKIEDDLSGLP